VLLKNGGSGKSRLWVGSGGSQKKDVTATRIAETPLKNLLRTGSICDLLDDLNFENCGSLLEHYGEVFGPQART